MSADTSGKESSPSNLERIALTQDEADAGLPKEAARP